MKRRGKNRLPKRRNNRWHSSKLEHLEARAMLSADLWQALETVPASPAGNTQEFTRATDYKGLALNADAMRSYLSAAPVEFSGAEGLVVELPRPDGTFEQFEVFKSNIMSPELAAKFPDIQTFVGQSLDGDLRTLQMDITPLGFHAQVLSNQGDSYLIDPYYHMEDDYYASFFKANSTGTIDYLGADVIHDHDSGGDGDHNGGHGHSPVVPSAAEGEDYGQSEILASPSGAVLRSYRVAVAATGEYTQFFGGRAGAMAAVVTAMTRIEGIYRSELAITFQLVPNNDELIYTDPITDPYPAPTNNGISLLVPNQTNLTAVLGPEGYDVGHVFAYDPSFNSYGVAALGSAGIDQIKAQAASVTSDPLSDAFYLVAAHEFGHQFGADHTWSHCGFIGPSDGIGVEPGSGSTIMAYPGLCGVDDLGVDRDPYFHGVSLQEIVNHVDLVIPGVGTRTPTHNIVPTIDAGPDYVIPASTPFRLTANGVDPEGNRLYYTWDQMNPGISPIDIGDDGVGPLFRFRPPSPENSRTFPAMESIVNNTPIIGELLPSTNRTIDFRVTVRDVVAGTGAINDDDVRLTVIDTGAPFQITSPLPGSTLTGGQLFDFTWDVAGTNAGPIDTQSVRITMSTDGGYTYPHVVLNSTDNDGVETAYVPNVASNRVRFRVEAVGNVFFDITDGNLTVLAGTDPPVDGGGTTDPPTDSCGVPLPEGTVSFAGAIGGNFFTSTHPILDNVTEPGMLGYDEVVLDFLRGAGTDYEIARSDYSIAVIGNDTSNWSFSNGTQLATGYEATNFYNINYITPSVWEELIAHDAIIILSSSTATAGGLTTADSNRLATVEEDIAAAVNERGLDLWVGAAGTSTGYLNFLPDNVVTSTQAAQPHPLSGLKPTAEGSLLGLTTEMTNANFNYAAPLRYFNTFDSDLFSLEYRYLGEALSVAGRNIAFHENQLMPAAEVPGATTQGLVGMAFEDLNLNGTREGNELGVPGVRFFIDYNGDGKLGLCEPTATTDEHGRFRLRSAYSGEFQILQVPTAGAVSTTELPRFVTIAADGTATLNAPLEFGMIAGVDHGAPGTNGSVPVAPGAFLGDSPVEDDGVIFTHGLKKGTNTVTIVSSVEHSNMVLNAWMDFNKDGDWNDPGERIFTNLKLTPGTNTYTFTIPSNVFDDSVLPEAARLPVDVRFRVGPTANIGPTANDVFGEIEDYQVYISQEPDSGLRAQDDTFEYVENQSGQVFNVLANDSSFFGRSLTIVPGSITNVSPVTNPPLNITVSPDRTRILFDASGVQDVGDITFEYMVQDSAGVTSTATVTLIAPLADEGVSGSPGQSSATFNNSHQAADVNGDGFVTGQDLALLLRELEGGVRTLPDLGKASPGFNRFIDVNGDQIFNSLDLLHFINYIRGTSGLQGEPVEPEPPVSQSSIAQDLAEETASPTAPLTENVVVVASPGIEAAAPRAWDSLILPEVPSLPAFSARLTIAEDADSNWELDSATEFSVATLDAQEELLSLLGSTDQGYSISEAPLAEDEIFADDEWEESLLSL